MVACSQEENTRTIKTLRVAIIPDQQNPQILNTYQQLLDHITSHTGLKTEMITPKTYEELLRLFHEKKIDLAMFGGVTYVKAHLQSNATPLVMRDVDGRFRSIALISASNPATRLQDLKDASMAFGPRLSTSGHYMPRYFFQQQNIIPERFFRSIKYSGAHDLTAEWVRDGKVDLGLLNSGIADKMFLDGRLNLDTVKVIWQSPPFQDYVWAMQPDISKKLRILICDTFLHMNTDAENKNLLKALGVNYYIPATHVDFENLEQVILQLEQGKPVP